MQHTRQILGCFLLNSLLILSTNYDENHNFKHDKEPFNMSKKEYNENYDLDSDSSSEEESPINIAPTPESKDYSSIVCPCMGKIIQGGNLISTVLYVIGKSYWLVSYVAQAGCTFMQNSEQNNSSWYWQGCDIPYPCDPKLNSHTLCLLDQIGDIALYTNIAFATVSCGLLGCQYYRLYKQNYEFNQ